MSILDRGPHTVLVQRMVVTKDKYNGNTYAPEGPPVAVRCSVQPVTAEESYALGIQAETVYKVICRDWPGGIHSKITWDGREWGQRGEAKKRSTGRRTRHQSVLIVATTAEGK